MAVRHVLSISELDSETLAQLIKRSLSIAAGDVEKTRPLAGKVVGTYFRGPSTRTRTAFTVGAIKLGASTVVYGPNDLQLVTGETIQDTARVLSGFLDGLVIRTNGSIEEMKVLASQDRMAVINAMSEDEHPTQIIADLTTILEEFGRLDDIHILYMGEGNNTAAALVHAVSLLPGMQLTLLTPEGYRLPDALIERASGVARKKGSFIEQSSDVEKFRAKVDVVYTTRWQTMGVPKTGLDWRRHFRPYSVTPGLMERVSKPAGTIFLHDLPAVRNEDVFDEVLDGPQSRAFRQAWHKMTSAMAVLEWCMTAH
jgi:ornithine carbamoyltransferase